MEQTLRKTLTVAKPLVKSPAFVDAEIQLRPAVLLAQDTAKSREGPPPGPGRPALARPLLHELRRRLLSLLAEVWPRRVRSSWPHTELYPPSIGES